MKQWIILICGILMVHVLVAQDASLRMKEANEFFQKKKYEQAIQQYSKLLDEGYQSEALYFNLGNAFFRSNQIGKAILNYERALLVAPNDAEIKHNLRVAYQSQKNQIEPLPAFFLAQWWNNLRMGLSSTAWAIIAIMLVYLGVLGFMVWLRAPRRKTKKIGFVAGFTLLLISALPFSLAYSRAAYEIDPAIGIVLQNEIALHTAPDDSSKSILTLYEGVKIHLLDQIGDWYKVQLENGEQGWLLQGSFEHVGLKS